MLHGAWGQSDTWVYFPKNQIWTKVVADGKPADSLERLQITLPYEVAVNGLNFAHFYLGGLHSAYVRGEALLAARRHPEAAAEFQKILARRGIVGADPIGALAHVQLGRALARSGDLAKSKAAYRDFLALWRDADATSLSSRKPRRNTPSCREASPTVRRRSTWCSWW